MTTGGWLPQLQLSQPYTMCHALRWVDPAVDCTKLATPAFGTNPIIEGGRDAAEALIRLCLTAPVAVQRAARLQGVRGVVQIRVPGLVEALQRSRERQDG